MSTGHRTLVSLRDDLTAMEAALVKSIGDYEDSLRDARRELRRVQSTIRAIEFVPPAGQARPWTRGWSLRVAEFLSTKTSARGSEIARALGVNQSAIGSILARMLRSGILVRPGVGVYAIAPPAAANTVGGKP